MKRAALFPDGHREGQQARIEAAWDLSWPLPIPRFDMTCPQCGAALVLKGWKFHTRNTGSSSPWRCDVRLKCVGCGQVPIFGVVIPQRMLDAATRRLARRRSSWIEWRDGKAWLAEAGFFD